MRARNLQELRVHSRAVAAGEAVSAILKGAAFRKEFKLTTQLGDAAASVPSNIAEGFGRSPRQFAQYLEYARGSANETRTHLTTALGRDCITESTCHDISRQYEVIGRMLTRLIQYLRGLEPEN
jgi:four helix bundle protein